MARIPRNLRRFEIIENGCPYRELYVPARATPGSAGYDFYAPCDIEVPALGMSKVVATYLKAYMPTHQVLQIFPRSSLAIKHGITFPNGVAIIDSDYADNPENEGNIMLAFINHTEIPYTIRKGEKCAQGIFVEYWTTYDDEPVCEKRTGGIGSTGK